MKDWMHAKKKEIENMTFDQAKEIVEKQIRLGKEGGQWCPRGHLVKALEIILSKAELYEFRTDYKEPLFDDVYKHYECPVCYYTLSNLDNFCPRCGQLLDWRFIRHWERTIRPTLERLQKEEAQS